MKDPNRLYENHCRYPLSEAELLDNALDDLSRYHKYLAWLNERKWYKLHLGEIRHFVKTQLDEPV